MTVSIQSLALILALLHIGSVFFISFVIRRQLGLFKIETPEYLKHFRRVLFTLSVIILIGNIIPIVVDLLTLFVETGRPHQLRVVSVLYALSNAITALVSAYLIWRLYRLAADTKEMTDFTAKTLKKENDDKYKTLK